MGKVAIRKLDERKDAVEERQREPLPSEQDAWEELYRLGEEIGRGWRSSQSAVEILAEMRR